MQKQSTKFGAFLLCDVDLNVDCLLEIIDLLNDGYSRNVQSTVTFLA
jgi:hypothetical protein